MKLALKYIFITENITETTWSLWIGTQLDLQEMIGGDEKASPKTPSLQKDGLKIFEKKSPCPKTPEVETIDLTDSPPPSSKGKAALVLRTPSLSNNKAYETSRNDPITGVLQAETAASARPPSPPPYFNQQRRIVSYKTLQDFYALLDKIERTSYVGALFLEAYAERLTDDLCKACWLKHNVNLDLY